MNARGGGASPRGPGARVLAPAKVNLDLRVLGLDANTGYHELRTVFLAIGVFDEVIVLRTSRPGVRTRVTGALTVAPEENLATRAGRLALEALGGEWGGVRVLLRKRIPEASGLGGGSSDAAAVLRLVSHLSDGLLSLARCVELAGDLGADVPFFLSPSAAAFGSGRGDRLRPFPGPERRAIVVVRPHRGVSTAVAYRRLDEMRAAGALPAPPASPPDRDEGDQALWSDWRHIEQAGANDFRAVALEAVPALAELFGALEEAGGAPVLLSGSGSAVFGVFGGSEQARGAARRLRDHPAVAWVEPTRTLTEMPTVEPVG